MKPKKYPKADLEKKRALFFQIGLVAALGISVVVFSSGREEIGSVEIITVSPTDKPVVLPPRTENEPARQRTAPPPRIDAADILILIDRPPIELPDIWDPDETNPTVGPIGPVSTGGGDEGGSDGYGDDEPCFIVVEKMPTFMGGNIEKFREWVASQLVYPELASRMHIEGGCHSKFHHRTRRKRILRGGASEPGQVAGERGGESDRKVAKVDARQTDEQSGEGKIYHTHRIPAGKLLILPR